MGNTEAVYQHIEAETFEDVEIRGPRNFDCVIVFDIGDAEKDWKAPSDGNDLIYEYLKLLDAIDIERRNKLFPQNGADFGASARNKEKDFYKNERKLVIKALTKLHVKCKHITAMTKQFEADKGLKFYYVGIGEKTARRFAHKINYELELDAESAISYLHLMDEPLAKATVSEEQECKDCLEEDWKNIFIQFDEDVAPEIYKPFDVLDEGDQKDNFEDSLFRIRDRLALLNELVTQDVELGGCGIYVPILAQKEHCIVDFYPLHTLEHLECILDKLFSWKALTYNLLNLPLEEIRSYFGEYIAIYFCYLEFMTIYFVPLAILGVVLQCMQWAEDIVLVEGIEYFALVVILWAVCFPILWRRKEFHQALKWGTLRFDFKERPRPAFNGQLRKSNVNGQLEEYFPYSLRNTRRLITCSVVVTFLLALFGSIVGVILLRVYVATSGVDYGTYFIAVANAFVIMFFNNIYGIFAEKLNEWENYRTETEYENNLIIKIFIFRFINSYATLYYIAFFRRYENEDSALYCDAEECMEDLAAQLGTIFVTQVTVSNVTELLPLLLKRILKKGAVASYFSSDEKQSVYSQYSSEIYERTFDDYCEILVSFGYSTLFVIAFPLAPLAALIGLIVEARIDGYKLCKLTRRPFPRQADDVGTWQLAMEVMGWAVLVTNIAIVCFAAGDLDFTFLKISDSMFEETLTALFLFGMLFIAVTVLNWCVASKPHDIEEHMQRQDHIERRVQKVGRQIERYLKALPADQVEQWKEWSPNKVASYLREVVYKNPEEYRTLEAYIFNSNFDGRAFDEADEHSLEKKLHITDHLKKRFILNARNVLEMVVEANKVQEQILSSAMEDDGTMRADGTARQEFTFTVDNFISMAEFFEEDLTGQSKRKLWEKVDKDGSRKVEPDEMENFVYFSIVVFIKAKHKDVRLPKKTDKRFRNRILKPLERWMLHYKVNANGLTFAEFDREFSQWLREYYKETEKVNQGGSSKYHTVRFGSTADDSVRSNSSVDEKVRSNTNRKGGKLNKLLGMGSKSRSADRDKLKNDAYDQSVTGKIELQNRTINRDEWTIESINWEKKLENIANAIDKTDVTTRRKIWDKFDRKKVERLDCDKSLSRLIYSLIALYIKTKDRNAKPPKYNSLQPLLSSICDDIKSMINSQTGNVHNNYITKHDFQTNISVFLKKIAQQRKQNMSADQLKDSHSITEMLKGRKR